MPCPCTRPNPFWRFSPVRRLIAVTIPPQAARTRACPAAVPLQSFTYIGARRISTYPHLNLHWYCAIFFLPWRLTARANAAFQYYAIKMKVRSTDRTCQSLLYSLAGAFPIPALIQYRPFKPDFSSDTCPGWLTACRQFLYTCHDLNLNTNIAVLLTVAKTFGEGSPSSRYYIAVNAVGTGSFSFLPVAAEFDPALPNRFAAAEVSPAPSSGFSENHSRSKTVLTTAWRVFSRRRIQPDHHCHIVEG